MKVPPRSETSLPKVVQAVAELAEGATNALSPVTVELASGAYETAVVDDSCAVGSVPVLIPMTAEAASSAWFVKSVDAGAFLIGHNLVPPGARFRYELRRN